MPAGPDHRISSEGQRAVRIFLLAVAVQLAVFLAAVVMFRNLRPLLTEEDLLIENLSALFFLIAALYGGTCVVRSLGDKKACLLVTVLGLVGFLDEISFGERLFGFSMPSIGGVKIDGVHDLIRIPLRPLRQWLMNSPAGLVAAATFASVAAAILLVVALVYRQRLRHYLGLILEQPVREAWSIFVFLLVLAILLDERIIRLDRLAIFEELLEMNAALALILVAWCSQKLGTRI